MDAHPIPATSGIYRITCTVTGKFYIGSTNNLFRRRQDHWKELRRNDHSNQKLQHAWNKYGEDSFTYEVIELVLPTFQLEREQYWLDKLKPWGNKGYNIAHFAQAFSLGLEVSPETRAKMSAAKRGKPSSRLGMHHLPATKEKLRAANLGKKQSAETCAKKSATHTGMKQAPHSAATIEKIRQTKRKSMTTLIVTAPDGTEYVVIGLNKFCKEHHLHHGHLIEVARGTALQHKGWIARYPDELRTG